MAAAAQLIDRGLRDAWPTDLTISGEVSGFRERTHWYFDLKDAHAVVSCVIFASRAARLPRPSDGDQVVITGRPEFYAKGGRLSVIASKLEPQGEGDADLALRKLIEELRGRGWLDQERKRPIPAFPARLAVVTSRSSAAWHDVQATIMGRCPTIELILADARVQGDDAPAEIAACLRTVSDSAHTLDIDAVILTRGGGSAEDLAAFNDPSVAESIVGASIPVIAAIGHETDTTIAELVADLRAATPTHAAVLASPDQEAVAELFTSRASRLSSAINRSLRESTRIADDSASRIAASGRHARIADARARLATGSRMLRASAAATIYTKAARLDRLASRMIQIRPDRVEARRAARRAAILADRTARLRASMHAKLTAGSRRLSASAREMHAVGPVRVLKRGYSVTLAPDGSALRSVNDAPPGTRIETRLADGAVRSVVGGGPPDRSRPTRRAPGSDDQLDLFKRGG
ncbi:MAG: exodeoxyribonuclease VII large subunit [Planctomycetota bacterium]